MSTKMLKVNLFNAACLLSAFSSIQPGKKHVDMETIERMCVSVHQQVKKDGFKPDLLVGLSRGGLVPLGYLAGEKMFNNRNTRTINLASYDDGGKQSEIRLLVP